MSSILDRKHLWMPEPNTGCYIWTGHLVSTSGGSGPRPAAMYHGRKTRVARITCEEENGPPPTPQHQAAHKRHCCNGLCINGGHLYWATQSENDMDKSQHVRAAAAKIASDAFHNRSRAVGPENA